MNSNQIQSGKDRPQFVLYDQLLTGCLEKIKKTIPRKCKELRDLCDTGLAQVKADANDEPLSANKYFRIFKLALDTKMPRLTEQILYHIQKLVAHGLMDGNHPDDCLYTEEEKPKSNGTLPRRLIDAIVDEVCKCTSERDQQVQLQVVRALLTIVATNSTEVHERSLLKVMSSLYYIHIACTNPVNQNTAKASLIQMISIVFKKMEAHSGDFSESLRRLNSRDSFQGVDSFRAGESVNSGGGRVTTTGPSSARLGTINTGREIDDGKGILGGPIETSSGLEETLVTFGAEEQYAHVTLTYLIDNVCLHEAKIDEVRAACQESIQELEAKGEEDPEKIAQLTQQAQDEEALVPLYMVPRSSKSRKKGDDQKTLARKFDNLSILNEQGVPSGKFGWCVACRGSANLYCKHTRHPVCSFECKQRHIKLLEDAQATHDEISTPRSIGATSLEEPHTRDALLVFNKLCQLLQSKELDGKLENVYDVRKVLLGLDLIHSCLENPGHTFINRREFVAVIRDSLGGALLKFAVSNEHKIFSRTVQIFYCLFLHFREHLKQTIGVFIDNFFLRILDSGNSEYDYKYTILEFFDRLCENTDHILEIFANYDCDITQKDICGKMLDSMSNIAQGRFQRADHTSVITPQQEASLRRLALETRVKLLRNLNRTIEAEVKLEGIAQAQLAERRQERAYQLQKLATQDMKNEDDESGSRGEQSLLAEQEPDLGLAGEEPSGQPETAEAKQYMQNRLYKSEMVKAAGKFNLKPKTGLKYLTDKGYLPAEDGEERVKAICKFLKGTPTLSPTVIGQFLGEDGPGKDLNRACRAQYIDEFDWTGPEASFFDALKEMLSGFRIPGEGQQIDRFMEKFGEKLAKDRPVECGNAEGIYYVAYATLMLQTSVHNPQAVKMKMGLADFRKITTGTKINDSSTTEDFDAFIADLYERVLREPFTLEEDEEARMKLEAATNTNKKLLFDKEREGILRRGAHMLKQDQRDNKFVLVKDISTIRPMFENTWSANLAVFSVVLDETEDPLVADLCLQGFMHAIRISGHFEIHEVRNAFVSSLSKFTLVSASKELKQKNISCIRELLNLAIHDGDCLRDSWSYVLDCISKIDHMRVLGLGDLTDSEYFQSEMGPGREAQPVNQQILMRNSAIIAEQIDANQIETIFLQSDRLKPDAIIDFIENLCRASREELADEDSPKKFCLQKLVEVASLNMDRVRFQWQSIWRTVGEHFTWVGSHKNLHVVTYAIDSLRQLAAKFLEKEERKSFSYQKMFLRPFETIMLNNLTSRQKEIKEYVVMCIAALCQQKAKYIRSGWEVILNIFTLAAQDTEAHLAAQSFQALDYAVSNHFGLLEESFPELVNCLSKFSMNPQQSTKALSLLKVCARRLSNSQIVENYVEGQGRAVHQRDVEHMSRGAPAYGIQSQFQKSVARQVPGSAKAKNDGKGSELTGTAEAIQLSVLKELWFPILRSYTGLMMEKSEQISAAALSALEATLEEHHPHFSEELWREIFSQVLLPVLDDIRIQVEQALRKGGSERASGLANTLHSLLGSMNSFLCRTQDQLAPGLLTAYTDALCLFASNIKNNELAAVVMTQYRALLAEIGSSLTACEQWNDVIEQISLLFKASMPKLLVEELKNSQSQGMPEIMVDARGAATGDQMKAKFENCYAKCTIQLLLTQAVAEMISRFFESLNIEQIQTLLQYLDSQYKFAKEFNSEVNLRFRLWKQGYMAALDHLPGLLAHEEESLKVYLSILFKQFYKGRQGQSSEDVSVPLFALCTKVLKDYILKNSELVSINTSKNSHQPGAVGNEDQLSALHETELEKQLSHQSPIVSQVILENLHKLPDSDLHSQKDLGQLLIDLTLCNDYQVRNKNHQLLSRVFEYLQSQKGL